MSGYYKSVFLECLLLSLLSLFCNMCPCVHCLLLPNGILGGDRHTQAFKAMSQPHPERDGVPGPAWELMA